QRAEQQSPSAWLPSSQSSRGSITPFPHLVRKRGPEGQVREARVPESSSPSPVPLYTKSGHSPVTSPLVENSPVPGSTVPVEVISYVVPPKTKRPIPCSPVPVCTRVRVMETPEKKPT